MAYFNEKFEVVLVNKWEWPRLCHLNGMLLCVCDLSSFLTSGLY